MKKTISLFLILTISLIFYSFANCKNHHSLRKKKFHLSVSNEASPKPKKYMAMIDEDDLKEKPKVSRESELGKNKIYFTDQTPTPAANTTAASAPPPNATASNLGSPNSSNSSNPSPQGFFEMTAGGVAVIKKCNEALKLKGTYIQNISNYTGRGPMTFVANMYTFNVFQTESPTTLVDSIEVGLLSKVAEMKGAPECLWLEAEEEKKMIIPCFTSIDIKMDFIKSIGYWDLCRQGLPLTDEALKSSCGQTFGGNNAMGMAGTNGMGNGMNDMQQYSEQKPESLLKTFSKSIELKLLGLIKATDMNYAIDEEDCEALQAQIQLSSQKKEMMNNQMGMPGMQGGMPGMQGGMPGMQGGMPGMQGGQMGMQMGGMNQMGMMGGQMGGNLNAMADKSQFEYV